ncbi:hypothetical protein P154DRAFT_205983 [Amniculicola lignicola CBS 123094]|uniref:Uncharacterized protein n=1 Tax=Amniculicola lignicola CBS 123094 TaxID=1392246 RepID=A0A6A5WDP8_9PLEO|nr:hypothetical protein P154DRAFT_205983 [Amniculicola lignicola CBS 123094]
MKQKLQRPGNDCVIEYQYPTNESGQSHEAMNSEVLSFGGGTYERELNSHSAGAFGVQECYEVDKSGGNWQSWDGAEDGLTRKKKRNKETKVDWFIYHTDAPVLLVMSSKAALYPPSYSIQSFSKQTHASYALRFDSYATLLSLPGWDLGAYAEEDCVLCLSYRILRTMPLCRRGIGHAFAPHLSDGLPSATRRAGSYLP